MVEVKEGDGARRVLAAATGLCGDLQRAERWYRAQPIPEFGHRTAEMLVSEGRADDVIAYIESLEAGATG